MAAQSKEIDTLIADIQKIQDIDRILDIQGKLSVLPQLHQSKLNPQHLFSQNNFEPLQRQEPDKYNNFNGYLDDMLPSDFVYSKVTFNYLNGHFSITGEFPDIDAHEGWFRARQLWWGVSYIGDEDCTENNRDTRVTIFDVTSKEPFAPALTTGADDQKPGYSYRLVGSVRQDQLNRLFVEDKKLTLVLPEFNVGTEGIQPGLCRLIHSTSDQEQESQQ